MTETTASVHSAYPVPVDQLVPRAQRLADELGEVPSRNRLMTELKIGAPKARHILDALTEPAAPTGTPGEGSARLHLVPTEETTGAGTGELAADGAPPAPDTASENEPDSPVAPDEVAGQVPGRVDPDAASAPAPVTARRRPARPVRSWPVLLLAAPAFVAIWSGWVGLGSLTGFGVVHPLPGIWNEFQLNTAITLPIGMETYAAYALRVWVSGRVPARARRFAKWSAIGSLILGALGQVAYHLMAAANVTAAPWPITTAVACLPVAVLGMGAALTHLLHTDHDDTTETADDSEAVR